MLKVKLFVFGLGQVRGLDCQGVSNQLIERRSAGAYTADTFIDTNFAELDGGKYSLPPNCGRPVD